MEWQPHPLQGPVNELPHTGNANVVYRPIRPVLYKAQKMSQQRFEVTSPSRSVWSHAKNQKKWHGQATTRNVPNNYIRIMKAGYRPDIRLPNAMDKPKCFPCQSIGYIIHNNG